MNNKSNYTERATGTRSNKHIARRECSVALSLHGGILSTMYILQQYIPPPTHPHPHTPIHIRYPPLCI